jgi:uncharacterized membrane protein
VTDLAIARALHILGVVAWIGGVAMVTTIVLPQGLAAFERFERTFARQARITSLITGATGFYLVHRMGLWPRFSAESFWWMHAMVILWALFTVVLFVLEPLFLHRWFRSYAARNAGAALRAAAAFHWLLLALSGITIAGAVAGSHGLL